MPGDNPTVEYNLLNDDAVLYLVTAIFQKLAGSPLAQNTTYGFSIDSTTKLITITDTSTSPATTVATLQTMNASTVQSMIDTAIGQITGISFQIVEDYAHLPQEGANGVIYLVPVSGASSPNVYEEYVWISEELTPGTVTHRYEKLGTTDVDLSGYVQFSDIAIMTNQQIASAVNTAYEAVWPSNNNA